MGGEFLMDLFEREMSRIFGPRGPAHLVALLPGPGVAQPARVSWFAIPSWDGPETVAQGLNAQAPSGWHARVADWDVTMPNELFIYMRDLIASGRCGDEGLAEDCSSAYLGATFSDKWVEWRPSHDEPPVPDVTDERIWNTP
jgi:hypothetical protein